MFSPIAQSVRRPGKWSKRSLPDGYWVQVHVAVVGVDALGPLQDGHRHIGERRRYGLEEYLEEPLLPDERPELDTLAAGEGDGDEEGRVGPLADDRGADGADPEETALGGHLQAREDDGVGELPDEERRETGADDAPCLAENGLVGLLVLPERSGVQFLGGEDRKSTRLNSSHSQ